jgi:hypothetical protein
MAVVPTVLFCMADSHLQQSQLSGFVHHQFCSDARAETDWAINVQAMAVWLMDAPVDMDAIGSVKLNNMYNIILANISWFF